MCERMCSSQKAALSIHVKLELAELCHRLLILYRRPKATVERAHQADMPST